MELCTSGGKLSSISPSKSFLRFSRFSFEHRFSSEEGVGPSEAAAAKKNDAFKGNFAALFQRLFTPRFALKRNLRGEKRMS